MSAPTEDLSAIRWQRMATAATDHRQATAERNVEAILDAAEGLLRRRAQPTIAAVAKESGVSRVTVYSHFATRADLVEAVVARVTRAATTSMEEAKPAEGDPVDALDRVLTVSWEQLERHEAIRRAAAEELDPAAIARSHESAARTVRGLIERGRRAGSFRKDLPVEWLIAGCLALLHTAADEVREKRMKPDDAMAAVKITVIELFTGR